MREATHAPLDRKRRADARRSIVAILDAAIPVLSERPQARMSRSRRPRLSRETVHAPPPVARR